MSDWPTGLMVIQGNRLESLKEVLVQWVKRYPLKPLETDVFLVQSNGIAQWLQQALAQDESDGGCGIAAAIKVELPGRFVWQAYRAAFWELDTQSPYDLRPMTWRLFRLLNSLELYNQDGCYQSLLHFMETGTSPAQRRFVLAQRIAKLFDQYQVYRADWLQAWQEGIDTLPIPEQDPIKGKAVPEEQTWQPKLWRLLVADVAADPEFAPGKRKVVNRSQIHQDFLRYCAEHTHLAGLPRRIVVFGLSSLPNQTLEVLQAIAPFTQVLLFTLNPSEYYWGDLIEGRQLLRQAQSRRPLREGRKDKPELSLEEAHLYGNPLLASWGKLGRDYLHSLEEKDSPDQYRGFFVDSKIDLFEAPGTATLLQQLQDDIFHLRGVEDAKPLERLVDVTTDRSLRFIETHSRQREIEVLHDQLLAEFELAAQGGEPLQPRDILIMAPDINAYVPHIEAVFGRYPRFSDDSDPEKRYLPFHIADQSARQQHPLVAAFEALLSITRSRFAATDLLSLLDVAAVRRRFSIKEEQVPLLKNWIESANIRWGLNRQQRQSLGLALADEQNTWLFGLKRMLLGYAMGDEEQWHEVLPYGEIGGIEAVLLGQLHQLIDRITSHWDFVSQPHSLQEWGDALRQTLEQFFTPETDGEQRIYNRIQDQIEGLLEQIHGSGVDDELVNVEVLQEAFMGQLDEPSLSQRFLAGSINFATLMPMRAIPFKQVYLIGMNDGDYPQVSTPMDFDLMVGDYRPGDRSRREDARYLFLEAVLSARDKLVISWQGRSAKDNTEQPPSVLVGQLKDYLNKAWANDKLTDSLTDVFPLQPFSRRYFSSASDYFTYQSEWQTAYSGESDEPKREKIRLPDWLPDAPLNIGKLALFLKSPVDAMYAERLDIKKPSEIEETKVVENFDATGLEVWQIHDRMLQLGKKYQLDHSEWDRQVEASLRHQIAAGELQGGAFAQIRRDALYPDRVKSAYFGWRKAIESAALIEDTLRQATLTFTGTGGALVYQDDLERLYQYVERDEYGNTNEYKMQFILQASKLYNQVIIGQGEIDRDITPNDKENKVCWRNVLAGWVKHIVANLVHGGGITTQLMSPSGDIRLRAMTEQTAREYLDTLISCWLEAMHTPVCFGINAGMTRVIRNDENAMSKSFLDDDVSRNHYASQHFHDPLRDEQLNELSQYSLTLCKPLLDYFKEEEA